MSPLRDFFIFLSHNRSLEKFLTTNTFGRKISRRFVAGETLEELIDVVRSLTDEGIFSTVAFLGEHYRAKEPALKSVEEYLRLAEALAPYKQFSEISLKLTQLGLEIDREFAYENLKRIASKTKEVGLYINVDTEESRLLDDTLNMVKRLNDEGYAVGTVVQAYLHRAHRILKDLSRYRMNIRLVKGAYKEPPEVAIQSKKKVDENYKRLAVRMLELSDRIYPEFATHDERIIKFIQNKAEEMGISKDRYEFQMLYGVRLNLQARVKRTHRLRLYVPYGSHWYPYFMRRLAERPANVWFVLRGLFG
ncbi:MAG: proline dehydrogenase [Thermotogae bacterium]|nr:proline dehydrogenase [Thermotogota bacterium]